MNKINIAFCINDAYADKVAVVMTSILENHPLQNISFYIFSSDLKNETLQKLSKLKTKYKNFSLERIFVPTDKFSKLKLNINYISIETYYRYIIADLLPQIDKILYLDADLIVNKNIIDFYNSSLDNNYLIGIEDLFIKHSNYKSFINFTDNDLYINAGVLLMNLRKIRQDNLSEKLINANIELQNKIKYQDQDILNIVCKGKIKSADSIFNFANENISYETEKWNEARIIHYTGPQKPWQKQKLKLSHALKFWKHKKYDRLTSIWLKYAGIYNKIKNKKYKVALIIDEFFGGAGTAFGGYGFLARKYIAQYIPDENIKIDVLLGRGHKKFTAQKFHVDDVDLYQLPKKPFASKLWLKKQNYDIYLSIELTSDWVLKHETNPHKKLILWIQDPRPKYEWEEIETVKLFKEYNYYNQEIYDLVHLWAKQNRVKFISQGYFLNQKAKDLYKLDNHISIQYLPNPIKIDQQFDVTHSTKKNNILFLGRIESVKRGWLFCEIAKRLPEYNFYVLGQSFREKDKNASIMAKYKNISNLHFVGHVEGKEKEQYLKDAKILVNTSIHEALPISFLEALSYGVCLVSDRNPEDLTSKFGIWTGQINGDGFDKLDLYVNAIKKLMTDESLRRKQAISGRKYIEQIHNIDKFQNDLKSVIYQEL